MAPASSSDEGEIVESRAQDLKATSLSKKLEGNGVDRQDRHRHRYSASRSPDQNDDRRYAARRSRSPPRGFKRSRDDRDYYSNNNNGVGGGRHAGDESSHFRGRHDGGPYRDEYRRSRAPYEDLDRPPSRSSNHSYDNRERDRSRDRDRDRARDRYSDKRPRHRSRSPFKSPRSERHRDDRLKKASRYESSRSLKYHDSDDRDARGRDSAPSRVGLGRSDDVSRRNNQPLRNGSSAEPSRLEHAESAAEVENGHDYEEPTVIDEEAEIERRRRRRDELLAKSSSATPLLIHALHSADRTAASSPAHTQQSTALRGEASTPVSEAGSPNSADPQGDNSPGDMSFLDDGNLINTHAPGKGLDEDGPSAADYDPTVDMKEDEKRDELRHGTVGLHGEPLPEPHQPSSALQQPPPAEEPQASKSATGADGGEDDDFDMFGDDFDEDKFAASKPVQPAEVEEADSSAAQPLAQANGGILEGHDKDGYYKVRIGEILNGRYQVQAMLGKGMFSGVARAVDISNKKLVAIKIMRNNDALRKGGFTEIAILQKLNDADPDNRKHIVKFERHFDHKGHLCMAFENLSLNLREVLRKFGNNVGINLNAVRAYAHQIFVGLAHMRKCSIIHADLKPDNILVNESRNLLKICDLGTGVDRSDAATAHNEITPYLVSRFYRAPEIMLGMPYDYAIDVWSIGCTLYEMYTGKILFTGDSNNQMLKAIMEIRGRITPKLYKRGQLSAMHFDDLGNFISVERDKALGKTAVRTLAVVKPTRDLRTRLLAASAGMNDAETRNLNQFIDLLEHCLTLNPEKRIRPSDALKHPFFTSRVGPSKR